MAGLRGSMGGFGKKVNWFGMKIAFMPILDGNDDHRDQ
jgi:hypothetical protein